MRNGKIIIARLWPNFSGEFPSVAPVIFGINPQKYETICIYLAKNSSNPNIFEQKGKKVFYITQRPKLSSFNFAAFFKLAAILKNQGVDILHCHKHKSVFYGTIAGKMASVPIILAHVHGIDRTRSFNRKFLNRFLLPHIDRMLAVGEAVKDDILQSNPAVNPEKVINIGNSIDLDYFASGVYDKYSARRKFGISENSFVFATAGRLAQNKGQLYLIRAFASVKKKIPNAELLIAGEGKLKDALKKESLISGCENSVHFLGKIDDMPPFYNAIDVFVLPSIGSEGLPRALIEAMAVGVPCIGTDTGGIPEILDNGQYGLMVPAKDEDALVKAMAEISQISKNRKAEYITSAKKYIHDNYSHATVIRRLEKIYETEINRCYEADKR